MEYILRKAAIKTALVDGLAFVATNLGAVVNQSVRKLYQ